MPLGSITLLATVRLAIRQDPPVRPFLASSAARVRAEAERNRVRIRCDSLAGSVDVQHGVQSEIQGKRRHVHVQLGADDQQLVEINCRSWLRQRVPVHEQDYNDAPPPNISSLVVPAVAGFNAILRPVRTRPPTTQRISISRARCRISNTYYNGKFGSYGGIIDTTRGGILTQVRRSARRMTKMTTAITNSTGEVRFQTSFDGPLNFSAGAFWMSYQARQPVLGRSECVGLECHRTWWNCALPDACRNWGRSQLHLSRPCRHSTPSISAMTFSRVQHSWRARMMSSRMS